MPRRETDNEQALTPIWKLPRAEFEALRDHYLGHYGGTGFPGLANALEIVRKSVIDVLETTPPHGLSPDARGKLATVADIATWALVMHRAADQP